MTNTDARNRQSPGQPTGGQFAAEAKSADTGVSLGGLFTPGIGAIPLDIRRELLERAGKREISDDTARRLVQTIPYDPDDWADAPLKLIAEGRWNHARLVQNARGEGDDFRDALHRHCSEAAQSDPDQMMAYSALATWSMNINPIGSEEEPPAPGIVIDRGSANGVAWIAMNDPNTDYDHHVYGGRMYARLPEGHRWQGIDPSSSDQTYDDDGNVVQDNLRAGMPMSVTFNRNGWIGMSESVATGRDPEDQQHEDASELTKAVRNAS